MKRRAFTLPELMIVVLTISILLVIAIPNFYKARATSRLHEILGNLQTIETMKQMCVYERGASTTDMITCNSANVRDLYMDGEWPENSMGNEGYWAQNPALAPTFRNQTADWWRQNATVHNVW